MNKYTLTSAFQPLDETEGILQNFSMTTMEYAVSDDGTPTVNTGLLIRPNQKLMFQLDGGHIAYVRSIRVATRDKTPYCNVVVNSCCDSSGGGGGSTPTETIKNWKSGATYKKGDFVVYNGQLYECSATHTAGSAFDSTKFSAIGGGGTTIANWQSGTSYSVGDLVIYNNTLYQCATAHTSGSAFTPSDWIAISNEQGTILPDFKYNEIYDKYDMVYRNGHIYRAKSAFTSGSRWNSNDWEDVSSQYTLPIASASTLGGVKIGSGITIASDGTISTTFDGNYNNLTNLPTLFSGNYNDLINKPTIFSGNYNDLANKPTLFSGSYNDLTNKPTIPSYSVFTGATSTTGGTIGLVPAPSAGDEEKFLCGDGTWQDASTVIGGATNHSQITKFNVTAPLTITKQITNNNAYCFAATEVLKHEAGTPNVSVTEATFSASENTNYADNRFVTFDGTLHEVTTVKYSSSLKETTSLDSIYESEIINPNDYKTISEVKV